MIASLVGVSLALVLVVVAAIAGGPGVLLVVIACAVYATRGSE